jgi:hypothetical protein
VNDGVIGITCRTGKNPVAFDRAKNQPAAAPGAKLLLPHCAAILLSYLQAVHLKDRPARAQCSGFAWSLMGEVVLACHLRRSFPEPLLVAATVAALRLMSVDPLSEFVDLSMSPLGCETLLSPMTR